MDFDKEFDEELDEDLGEELELEDIDAKSIDVKTPAIKLPKASGKKITIYFMSTIGPGEKKQKLTVNDGNIVGDIKQTVGNIFALDPNDFHLSSGGVTMDENSPLKEYNVANGDDILLIPASTAG